MKNSNDFQRLRNKNALYNEANILPENLDLSKEFLNAFNLLENTSNCIFITGKAGTGKSTLLKYFKSKTQKKVVVIAPTGIAAINVGGQTVHSFFKFPPRIIQKKNIERLRNGELLEKLDTVIIDEISMVRADLMDGIDYALRINRDEMKIPFGGAQVILFGDLFQLPPVVNKEEREIMDKEYKSPYFFDAKIFNNIKLCYVELTKIYRQVDQDFIDILNKIRNGEQVDKDLDKLNERVDKKIQENSAPCIILTTTNQQARNINEYKLSINSNKEFKFEAKITGTFDENIFPTEYCLRLKKGAQIMLIKNDINKRWVNGTLAEVEDLSDDKIMVKINKNIYEVPLSVWQKVEYKYNSNKNDIDETIIGTFIQYPLKLAWAITIHKSQGQTFNNVSIDIGHGAFAHGQIYVGLSRCTSLKGITLKKSIIESDIILDKRIYNFRNKFIKHKL
ncbi:MAG: AAA family ATPase [Endomicrobiales bacterium]|nr:AAA family ATPase [Endomicrobiales bacterium]